MLIGLLIQFFHKDIRLNKVLFLIYMITKKDFLFYMYLS